MPQILDLQIKDMEGIFYSHPKLKIVEKINWKYAYKRK